MFWKQFCFILFFANIALSLVPKRISMASWILLHTIDTHILLIYSTKLVPMATNFDTPIISPNDYIGYHPPWLCPISSWDQVWYLCISNFNFGMISYGTTWTRQIFAHWNLSWANYASSLVGLLNKSNHIYLPSWPLPM